MFLKYTNDKIVFSVTLDAYQLVEAYEKGELKGKLKEIAAKLDEEDNPVIMLVKHKKQEQNCLQIKKLQCFTLKAAMFCTESRDVFSVKHCGFWVKTLREIGDV